MYGFRHAKLARRIAFTRSSAVQDGAMRGVVGVIAGCACALALAGVATGGVGGAYGGIGAPVAAFKGQNTQGGGVPPLGLAYYTIDSTQRGRVTAFHVIINARPRFASQELVGLVLGINVPDDAAPVHWGSNGCVVYRSRRLQQLVGLQYAVATASRTAQTAWLRVSSRATC